MGELYLEAGDYSNAARNFQQALTCNPNSEEAKEGAIRAEKAISGELDEASEELDLQSE